MSKKRKARKPDGRPNRPSESPRSLNLKPILIVALLAFVGGAGAVTAGFLTRHSIRFSATQVDHGSHSVWELLALPDDQLHKVDVVEMNLDVAREIPGMEHLDINQYRQAVDGWTKQFADWLPTAEQGFYRTPEKWKNDVRFFRIGMLAQFLDQRIGVHYLPWSLKAQQQGVKDNKYTDSGDLFINGLIDHKTGTCASMPVLHVAIGRRMGWPVSLACVGSHFYCRFDDGKVVYNIEATNTGRGGFDSETDADYAKHLQIPDIAKNCGSDLRSLTDREMLAAFIADRARILQDRGRIDLADADYSLARSLFPTYRETYHDAIEPFLWRGQQIFEPGEEGSPQSIAELIVGPAARNVPPMSVAASPQANPQIDVDQIMEINRQNMEQQLRAVQQPNPYGANVP